MNRNYPLISSVHADKRDADSRSTDICVMQAIACLAETMPERPNAFGWVWENPSQSEFEWVRMCLNEWARHGDIEPGTYCWGDESIDVAAV